MLSENVVLSSEHEITLAELKNYISSLTECDFTFNILDTYRHIAFNGDKIKLYNNEDDLLRVTVTKGQEERVIACEDIIYITLQILSSYSIATFYPVGRLLIFPRWFFQKTWSMQKNKCCDILKLQGTPNLFSRSENK